MNKSLVFITVCGVLYGSGAQAQSPVSIYGVMDASIANDSGRFAAGPVNTLVSGGQAGTRIGFRGMEDLGGGVAAIFNLESGVNIDDGALSQGAGILFGRKAFIGLQGRFGSIKMGRQDSAVYASTVNFDPFMEGITGAYTRIMSNISALRRNDNTIDYTSQIVNGFKGEAAYSFGEIAGNSRAGRGLSGSVTYAKGPFSVGLSHQQANSKPTAPAPILITRMSALGASYDLKMVKLFTLFASNRIDGPTQVDARDMLVGVSMPFGVSAVQASYIRHEDKAVKDGGARQIAVGYTHALSKRTNLYGRYAHISNEHNARFGLAAPVAGGSISGTSNKLVSVGICQIF